MYHIKLSKKITFLFVGVLLSVSFLAESPRVLAACTYPAQVLDLTNCKQTLPIGESGSPTEILQPMLASYSGNPYFHANSACDGVVFRAPVNGVTTSNSGYPRSELREMTNAGKDKASWSTAAGTHTMFIDQAITAVPKNKKHIVAGQIHDANDDVIVIRLEYPKLFVDINGETGPTLDPNYVLGKRFTVKFVAENGQIKIYYNGNQSAIYTMSKSISGCYFKAGAYTQSNCSKESDCSDNNFGEVIIYKLALNGQIVVPVTDTTIPNISISSPANGAIVSGATNLLAVATDNIGLAGVQFKINGNNLGSEDTSLPYSVIWDTTAVMNGNYDITAIAKDSAGNIATTAVNTVTVNNIPRTFPETSLSTLSDLSFEAEAAEIMMPMQVISEPNASAGKYIVQTTDSGEGSARYTVNVPTAGKYQLRVKTISPNGSANSFYYNLDNGSVKTWNLPDTIKSWTWVDGASFDLTQGIHTIGIKNRERNTQIDAFELKHVTSVIIADSIDGTVPLEAESGLVSGGMHILEATEASGGKYVQADSSGTVLYRINIPTAGIYRLAGWIKAASGSADSFYVSVDGKSSVTWTLKYPTSSWTYDIDDGHSFSLTAGVHMLAIKHREVGAKIDKAVLVKQ